MEELLHKAEIKGIPLVVYPLLYKYGWTIWVSHPSEEWRNEYYIKNNETAIEQALIEIDYLI